MYWLLQTLLHITVTALRLLCANNPWNMLKACLGEHISIVLQAYVRLHDFGALHSSAGLRGAALLKHHFYMSLATPLACNICKLYNSESMFFTTCR
ncbi:hypothetical protein M758_UG222300 [Ceratodon purpureus]|nr:hypothetical protein M758_UG222300 [Ceratodon purpureus]KAG0596077.1 hypothetical protein M758_UG222300 [Ceratodon purpureus]